MKSIIALPAGEEAFKVLVGEPWGHELTVVADLITSFVYQCWQHRIGVHSELAAQDALVDGGDAMMRMIIIFHMPWSSHRSHACISCSFAIL